MDINSPILSKGVVELDHLSFQQLMGSTDKLVIVEFYLTDCPVCQAMEPVYEALSEELAEEAVFGKIDAQVNLDLALQYGVVGTPTYKLFCKDKFLGEIVGETNATVLRNTIRDMIRHQAACSLRSKKVNYELDGYG
jgi:thiol-disulfide isomerase/thioredoxin